MNRHARPLEVGQHLLRFRARRTASAEQRQIADAAIDQPFRGLHTKAAEGAGNDMGAFGIERPGAAFTQCQARDGRTDDDFADVI